MPSSTSPAEEPARPPAVAGGRAARSGRAGGATRDLPRAVSTWLAGLSSPQLLVVLSLGAAVLALVAALVFAKVTGSVLSHGDAASIDQNVNRWVLTHRSGTLTDILRPATHLADGIVIVVLTAVVVAALGLRRRWWLAGFMVITAAGTALLTQAVKALIGRPRPLPDERLVPASGAAFPSGHAAQSVACYLAIAVVVAWVSRSPVKATAAAGGAIAVAVLVGVSRVYLGVHWTSDVVAGWTLGLAWLTGTSVGLVIWSRIRRGDATPAAVRRTDDRRGG